MNFNQKITISILSLLVLLTGALVLTQKSANAQVAIGGSTLPRFSDLWEFHYRADRFITVTAEDGSQIPGYQFSVSPDALGRLPVITGVTPISGGGELWGAPVGESRYRLFFDFGTPGTVGTTIPTQIRLTPGQYLIKRNTQMGVNFQYQVLSGYLAKP